MPIDIAVNVYIMVTMDTAQTPATTLLGTVTTGYGAIWELHRNGRAQWAQDQYGVILSAEDGLSVAALITEMHRQNESTCVDCGQYDGYHKNGCAE